MRSYAEKMRHDAFPPGVTFGNSEFLSHRFLSIDSFISCIHVVLGYHLQCPEPHRPRFTQFDPPREFPLTTHSITPNSMSCSILFSDLDGTIIMYLDEARLCGRLDLDFDNNKGVLTTKQVRLSCMCLLPSCNPTFALPLS